MAALFEKVNLSFLEAVYPSFVQIQPEGEVLSPSDKTTFYVRDSKDSKHVKIFITQDLAELTLDQPAIEIGLALYEKSDQKHPPVSQSVELFIDALRQSPLGSKQKGLIEELFITSGVIEIRKASSCNWTEAMQVIEPAFELLTDGEQIDFVPFTGAPIGELAAARR